jgi:fermentation-respiration switch protein FrsA (DUF1100 family)
MPGFAGQKLVSILTILAVIYIIILILFLVFQSRFLYFPSKSLDFTPDEFGMTFEDIFFSAADSIELNGWFIPAEESTGTILFCHGNAGNISHRIESVKIFNDLKMDVFIFDYRGYGKSKGKISENGTYIDSEAALDYLIKVKNKKQSEIIVFGRSLGGSVAAHLAKERKPGALIIESTFTSVNDIASDVYPFLPVRLISRFKYNTLEYVRNTKCPLLVIHSRQDELINFKHGQQLYETAGEPKMFLELTGAHNEGFILSGKSYIDGIKTFIKKHYFREE